MGFYDGWVSPEILTLLNYDSKVHSTCQKNVFSNIKQFYSDHREHTEEWDVRPTLILGFGRLVKWSKI